MISNVRSYAHKNPLFTPGQFVCTPAVQCSSGQAYSVAKTHTGYQAQRTIHVLKQVNSVTSDNGAATMVYLFIRTTSGTQISVPGTKMSYVPL